MKKWDLVRNIDQKIVQSFIQELEPLEVYMNAFGEPRDFHFDVHEMTQLELDNYNLIKRQELYPSIDQFIYAAVAEKSGNPAPMQSLIQAVNAINQAIPVVAVPVVTVPVGLPGGVLEPPNPEGGGK